jgi:hypothetical protein
MTHKIDDFMECKESKFILQKTSTAELYKEKIIEFDLKVIN